MILPLLLAITTVAAAALVLAARALRVHAYARAIGLTGAALAAQLTALVVLITADPAWTKALSVVTATYVVSVLASLYSLLQSALLAAAAAERSAHHASDASERWLQLSEQQTELRLALQQAVWDLETTEGLHVVDPMGDPDNPEVETLRHGALRAGTVLKYASLRGAQRLLGYV